MVPLTMMMHGYQLNTPEGLDDVGGDSGSSLVGVGLPGQRDAVLWHVCDYGFVRRTWQLEGLCGLSHRGVCTLWMEGGNQSREERERKKGHGGRERRRENIWLQCDLPWAWQSHNVVCVIPLGVAEHLHHSPCRLSSSHPTDLGLY